MLYEIYETIRELLDRGGDVMVVLAWVVFIMWTLIIERLIDLVLNQAGRHAACPFNHQNHALNDQ